IHRVCGGPTQRSSAQVRNHIPGAKVIGFPRGVGTALLRYVEDVPVDAVGLDWTVDPAFARDQIQRRVPVQGNLDPLVLLGGGAALDRAVDNILEAFSERAFIFNLGHGILPQTPIAHVEQMLARERGAKWWSEGGMYVWLKAFHVIAIIAWMAGMLYLPRLFVYHCKAEPGSKQSETFKVMERRLLNAIITPAMVVSWALGLWLAWTGGS